MDYQAKTDWSYNDTVTEQDMNRIEAGLGDLHERLDVDSYEQLTLKPGLQIINAKKNSPFQLTGLKGRTLLNLSGSDWTPTKNITRFINYQSTLSIDNNKSVTSGNALKITAAVANSIADGFGKNAVNLISGKKYIALGHFYNETGQSMKLVIQNTAIESPVTTSKNKWEFVYVSFAAGGNVSNAYPIARLTASAVGNAGYADALRLYEISDTEYAALSTMTSEQIAATYPYVDSLSPVCNPYMIAYGENLLPTLQEWTNTEGTPSINNRYSVDVSSTNKMIHNSVAVVPGATYTLSAVSSASTGRIFVYNTNGAVALADSTGSGSISVTFKVPVGVNVVEVRLLGTGTTPVNLSNVMLNVGSTAKSFKPREDTMLALQTDLYANPVTGTNADEVFERDGQYFRLAKWRKISLDDNLPWELFTSLNGMKIVKVDASTFNATLDDTSSYFAVKHDGSILDYKTSSDRKDQIQLNNATEGKRLFVSISSIDSGWGDNYTPTSNEIKAYFLGYKMFDVSLNSGDGTSMYNGSNETNKRWTPLDSFNGNRYFGSITSVPIETPNSSNTQVYTKNREITSYQLVYQLSTPNIIPVVSEGNIRLFQGNNQIEVGSGIIVREAVKPELGKIGINADRAGYNINNPSSSTSSLTKNKIDHFITIYKNNKKDQWTYYDKNLTAAGAIAQKEYIEYDQTASYSVTYIMLNKLPYTSFTGKLSLNENTLLNKLLKTESEIDTRLSVIENKKSNIEESLIWVNPTMLNGWANISGRSPLAYSIKGDIVRIRGEIRSGSIGTSVFVLPTLMRPQANASEYIVYSYGKSGIVGASIVIFSDGRFVVQNGSSEQISLGNIEFSL
ncbi:hypothetical protein PTI45_00706 [Paenibacillus nuruki]|uniref:Uncharacterized protein n=1 Tax=Paenibacillus nuruki TaxID=1886670 RepID=A0A1E3L8L8_9BACL|nr:hypothetical protein [Paenibacillus nuruki]ODP29931.1 hypothetical protein PTI45_00706 [Paenibacillus nuruki]